MNAFSTDNILANNITGSTVTATNYLNLPYDYERSSTTYTNFLPIVHGLQNQVVSVNLMYWIPIFIQRDLTISEVAIFVGTGSAGASVAGLYDSDATGLPNNLLFQTTAFNNAVTGAQTFTLGSPQTVNAGLYYIGYNSNSTVNLRSAAATSYIHILSLGSANDTPHSRISKTFNYTGTLPATFAGVAGVATKSFSVNPNIIFKINY